MTLPPWAVATPERRAHIERVVALLDEWARAMGVSDAERARWVKAAWLHDALRDEQRSDELAHGPRAAARAAHDGERDRGVLDAVRYHTVGYVHWDDVGRMLYLADFLEPGRPLDATDRAALAARVLRQAGIDVVAFGNAPATLGTLDSTRIVMRRPAAGTGDRIRRALGVGRVVVQADSTRLLDASVLLGADFAPRLKFHP